MVVMFVFMHRFCFGVKGDVFLSKFRRRIETSLSALTDQYLGCESRGFR